MPINPQIVVPQIQGIQLENPLALARNAMAIQEAKSTIAANQLKSNRAALATSIFKQNAGKPPEEIANALFAAGLPDEAENVMKFQTAGGQSTKARREAEVAGLQLLGSEAGAFANDPASLNKAAIMPWATAAVQRGLLSPEALTRFKAMPDDPQALSAAMRRLQVQALTPAQQTETQILQQDLGGKTRVMRIPKLGGRGEVVPETEAVVTASPNRPLTQFLMPGETARSRKIGELGGEALVTDYNAARSAVTGLSKDYEVLRLLNEGKPTTGITAELETNIDSLVASFAGDREAASRASDSELLEALLGQDVFQQFQSLGVGARGLDTKNEREFLQAVISGRKSLNKETITRMTEMRAKYKEQAVDSFNERVRSGELDEFFRDFGRPKREFKKPERPKLKEQPVTVQTPDGKVYTFPNQAAADKFRKDAGL
jgi:hypothetical protein